MQHNLLCKLIHDMYWILLINSYCLVRIKVKRNIGWSGPASNPDASRMPVVGLNLKPEPKNTSWQLKMHRFRRDLWPWHTPMNTGIQAAGLSVHRGTPLKLKHPQTSLHPTPQKYRNSNELLWFVCWVSLHSDYPEKNTSQHTCRTPSEKTLNTSGFKPAFHSDSAFS